MVDEKKKGGGLLGWLRGDKRDDETEKIAIVKVPQAGGTSSSPPSAPSSAPSSSPSASSRPSAASPPSSSPSSADGWEGEVSSVRPVAPGPQKKLTSEVTLRYVDKGEVARGGMGSIRKVFDENLQRSVAMKVMFPEHRNEAKIVQRFAEEAQIMGQLEHPNIVPVHDFGEDDGTKYFTMLYVRGKTLTELLADDGGVDSREAYFKFLNIFLRVLDAVAFAHSRGVVHRDLKPDNIMVGNFGEVYLMDWGIAKLLHRLGGVAQPGAGPGKTIALSAIGKNLDDLAPVRVRRAQGDETGQIIGTFFYMAPEQAHAHLEQIDERTDIFLLGGVLYEILTKQPPYMGSSVVDVVRQAQSCRIVRPEMLSPESNIPPALADICMKCLQSDQAARYQSVLELKKDIENFLKGGAGLPVRTFKAGEHLMVEGERGDEVFIVQRGTVQVYTTQNARRRGLATLGPGAVVGEAAVFRSAPRSASVVAADDVQAVVVTRRQLEHELGLNTWVGSLVKALSERFFSMNDKFTKADEQLDVLRVSNWVLQYLYLYGHTGPSGRREVAWTHMRQAAMAQFQRPEADIRTVLAAGNFAIDETRDALWFAAT
jgi:serine/threonine-protein kinase